MNQIDELPYARNHGLDFNYAVWTANTTISLCTVPWNSDYRDVVRFASPAALDSYLLANAGPHITIDNATYATFGKPIVLDIPFNNAQKYNYIRAFNPAQPIDGDTDRAFYYFITGVDYINPSTTRLTVQLDIWQTFGYSTVFGNCYIERGHIGIANENAFADYGREFLTIPEGLDIGGEYVIEKQWSRDIATARNIADVGSEFPVLTDYDIMVISSVKLDADPGTLKEPNLQSATGSKFENLPNGCEIYIFNNVMFDRFLKTYSDKPWVTQGIISITAIPVWDIYDIPQDEDAVFERTAADELVQAIRPGQGSLQRLKTGLAPDWRNTVDLGRYSRLDKLKTYPYMMLELTTYTGTPLVIKPESWNDPDATVVEVPHFAPPSPRLAFYPYRYNAGGVAATTDRSGVLNDGGEFLDMATGIFNFPSFSIVNNAGISYLASNAHGIAFQHASADWSQSRALQGNALASNQATQDMNLSQGLNRIGVGAQIAQANLSNETAGWRGLQSGANSVVNGVAQGGTGGLISGGMGVANAAASYAIETNQRTMSTSIGVNASEAGNRASVGNMGYMRDTNRAYADMATQGDYQNQIAGINAKVQDARLIQPTTSGQIGGEAFNLVNYKWGYDIKLKMMHPAALAAVGEYMLRYGYAVNRFGQMPSSFMVMEKFTYWKLRETYILSAQCPETFKQALRGIFEKGVTVWSNPNDIGSIDLADNAPLTGVTL